MRIKFDTILLILLLLAAIAFVAFVHFGCSIRLAIPGAELDAQMLTDEVLMDPCSDTNSLNKGD